MSSASSSPAPLVFVTSNGVEVTVAPPDPPCESAPFSPFESGRGAPVIVGAPPPRPEAERDTFLRAVVAEHGEYIRRSLLARSDVVEESTKDLYQCVLLALDASVQKHGEPEHMRAFIAGVIRNEVRHHKRGLRPDVDREADADAVATSAPGPETNASRAERGERLRGCLAQMPARERAVLRLVDLVGLTIDEAAEELGIARGTASTRLIRARAMLAEMIGPKRAGA